MIPAGALNTVALNSDTRYGANLLQQARQWPRVRQAAQLLGVIAGLMVGAAPVANAALGLKVSSWQSSSNSNQMKAATAICPLGTLLFSGGASISGGNGQVVLKAIIPEIGTPSRIIAIAVEDQTGTNANWSLSAYAICGNYAVVPVAAHTASNSVSPKSTTATCPTGKRVVGASAAVFSGGGQVLLDDFIPNSTLTAVTAKAYEDGNGYSATWDLIAYAMCADFAFPGLERRSADSSAGKNSQSPKTAMVGCSSSGKRVIGLGTAVDDGFGQVLIDDALPNSSLTQVTVRAYEDETGHSQSWDILAYVICALP